MQTKTGDPQSLSPAAAVGLAVVSYGVNYVAYGFLTFAILASFAALVFSYTTFSGPGYLTARLLAVLLPLDSAGNANIGGADILSRFGLLTLILQLAIGGVRAMWNRVVRRNAGDADSERQNARAGIVRGILWKAAGVFLLLSAIFGLALLRLPYAQYDPGSGAGGMAAIFAVFYALSLVCALAHLALEPVSEWIFRMTQPPQRARTDRFHPGQRS